MSDFDDLRASREAGHPSSRALETLAFAPEGTTPTPPVEAHVQSCDTCRARVTTLREERARFLQRKPTAAFVSRVLEKSPRRAWWKGAPWLFGLLPAAVAVALVLLMLPPEFVRSGTGRGATPDVRLKGVPGLGLEVLVSHAGEAARPLAEGEPVGPGETLRFRVTVPGQGYVFIANLDEAGQVTRYFPGDGVRGALLEAGEYLLPGGVVLDDSRGEERITLFFSPKPLEERDIEAALHEERAVSGASVSRLLRKGSR